MTIKTGLSVPAAVFAAALLLTGCGGSDASTADQTPGAASSGGPSSGPGAHPSSQTVGPGDGATDGTSGDVGTGGRALPEGFPESEIPVAAGTIVDASKGDAGGPFAYTVLIQVPGTSHTAVMKQITAQLGRTGFKAAPGPTTAKASIATFTNATYDVGVNVVRDQGKTVVTYVVVRKNR